MNGVKWFSMLCVLAIAATGCKKKKPKPAPPKKRVAKRTGPIKTQLPRGVKVFPNEVVMQVYPFQMGSNDTSLRGAKSEAPQHLVKLQYVFAMARREVTQDEFRQMMGYNPSRFKKCGKNCPVETVNWHEAAFYCNRLSQKHGLSSCFRCSGKFKTSICDVDPSFQGKRYYQCNGFRLPTEAEWEYSARAGSSGIYYDVPTLKSKKMVTTIDRISFYGANSQVKYAGGFRCTGGSKNSQCGTHPVGKKTPNKHNLYDMVGNVSEWVFDRYAPYLPVTLVNPIGSAGGPRVFRGCNWFHELQECRLTRRFRSSPSLRNNLIGFRTARTLVRATQPQKKK